MINLNRGEEPESLKSKKIIQYIDDLIEYKNNPEGKTKPEISTAYRNCDLLLAFDRDFHGKCYLTEKKYVSSHQMDVEHFIPQVEDETLKYSWKNLYPADHTANLCKPKRTPPGGYLDPCSDDDDVEKEIYYFIGIPGNNISFEPRDPNNVKAANTAQLLKKLHLGQPGDKMSMGNAKALQTQIVEKAMELLDKIGEYYDSKTDDERLSAKIEIKRLISRRSSFTMLLRSLKRVKRLPEDFFD